MEYEAVIGLETHVQLKTKSKMWCGCANEFGAEPNTHVCPVCLGLPGVLPVANEEALRLTTLTGRLLHCDIPAFAKFDRKNYFYPDMPKNYQITQYDRPSTIHGYVEFEFGGALARVRITRAHLEEDVGKSFHFDKHSGVDFNGRPKGQKELGAKIEIKNMNSFSGVRKALEYEIPRQIGEVSKGHQLIQSTRRWDDVAGMTEEMRTKEHAHDYRYFPDPDLMPFQPTEGWLEGGSSNPSAVSY